MPASTHHDDACPHGGHGIEWLNVTDIRERLGIGPQARWLVDSWQNQKKDALPYVQLRQRGRNQRVVRSDWLEDWLNDRAHINFSTFTAGAVLRRVAPEVWRALAQLTMVGRRLGLDPFDLDHMDEEVEEYLRAILLRGIYEVAERRGADERENQDRPDRGRWYDFAEETARLYRYGERGV